MLGKRAVFARDEVQMPSRREKEWLLAVISRRTTGTPWRAATCRRTDVPHTRATGIMALIDWQCGSFISGLRIFMQFYVFTDVEIRIEIRFY